MQRLAPVAIAGFGIGWLAYLGSGAWEASTAVCLGSAIAIGGAVLGAAIPSRHARIHTAIAAALMLAVAGFAATRITGDWPFVWDALADRRYAAFIAVMGAVVAAGLVRGAFWARWAAMAFSAGSILGGTLNSIGMWSRRDEVAWLAAIGVVGGLVIGSQLCRASVREHFARSTQHAVWASRDRLIRTARWAAVANFAAAPMLLLYAFGQPVAPRTVISALVLAPVLGLGSALVVMRRAAGVAILGAGGLALLAHTIATVTGTAAADVGPARYYASFWLPAALLGIAAAAVALRRARG